MFAGVRLESHALSQCSALFTPAEPQPDYFGDFKKKNQRKKIVRADKPESGLHQSMNMSKHQSDSSGHLFFRVFFFSKALMPLVARGGDGFMHRDSRGKEAPFCILKGWFTSLVLSMCPTHLASTIKSIYTPPHWCTSATRGLKVSRLSRLWRASQISHQRVENNRLQWRRSAPCFQATYNSDSKEITGDVERYPVSQLAKGEVCRRSSGRIILEVAGEEAVGLSRVLSWSD